MKVNVGTEVDSLSIEPEKEYFPFIQLRSETDISRAQI